MDQEPLPRAPGSPRQAFEESAFSRLLAAVEDATGKPFGEQDRHLIIHGPDEVDLVNSGLEETMVIAYEQIRERVGRDARVRDLRTAAFLNALDKIAVSYLEMGVFP